MTMREPSEETQQRAKETVEAFIENAGKVRGEHLEFLDEWHKHYAVEQSTRTYMGRAQTADPSTHENVETIAPRVYNIVTDGGELHYEAEPIDRESDIPAAAAINATIKSDLKMAKARPKIISAVRECVKNGTVVTRWPWRRYMRVKNTPRYEEIVKSVTDDDVVVITNRLIGYEKEEKVVYEGVDFEVLDLRSVWLDPFTADVDEAQGIAEERVIDFEKLEKEKLRKERVEMQAPDGSPTIVETMVGHYFNLDKLKERLDNIVTKKAGDKQYNKDQDKKTPYPQANIKDYWGWFDYEGNGKAVDCIITLAQDDIIIRCEPSTYPLRPYNVARHIPIANQTYGIGVCKIMSPIQKMINDLQNQIFDRVTQELLPTWLLQEDSDLEDSDLEFGQNKVLRVPDIERTIGALRPNTMPRAGWDGVEFAKESGRAGTGAAKTLQSTPMQYHTTATEVDTMRTEANARLVLAAAIFEDEWVVSGLRRIIEYNHEFMGPEKVFRITNDEAKAQALDSITPEDIAGQWDFTPLGATKYARQMKMRQEWSEFNMAIQPILSVPPEIARAYDMRIGVMLREVSLAFSLPNVDKIFPSATEEVQQPPEQGQGGAIEGDVMAQFIGDQGDVGGI